MPSTIDARASLFDHFRDQVEAACFEEDAGLTEDAGLYLVQLLTERARSDNEADRGTTLAELTARAAAAAPAEQARAFRGIGDRALHDLGYFTERVTRGIVSPDYYASMGRAAYHRVDRVTKTWFAGAWGDLFEELSDRFAACVAVVARVRRHHDAEDDADVLYERWLATGDEEVARRLRSKGFVIPRLRPEG